MVSPTVIRDAKEDDKFDPFVISRAETAAVSTRH